MCVFPCAPATQASGNTNYGGIGEEFPTSERGIIGESLAGLFIFETFLLEPALFRDYIAIDPSLWWNRGGCSILPLRA